MEILDGLKTIEDSLTVFNSSIEPEELTKKIRMLDKFIETHTENEVQANCYRLKGICEYFLEDTDKCLKSLENYFSNLNDIKSDKSRYEIQICLYICIRVSIIQRQWFNFYSYFCKFLECSVNKNQNYVNDWSLSRYSNEDKIRILSQKLQTYLAHDRKDIRNIGDWIVTTEILKNSDSFNQTISMLNQGLNELFEEETGTINPDSYMKIIEELIQFFILKIENLDVGIIIKGVILAAIHVHTEGYKDSKNLLAIKTRMIKANEILSEREKDIKSLKNNISKFYLLLDEKKLADLYKIESKTITDLDLLVDRAQYEIAIREYLPFLGNSHFNKLSYELKARFYFKIGYSYYRMQYKRNNSEETKALNYENALNYYNKALNILKDDTDLNKMQKNKIMRKIIKINKLQENIYEALENHEKCEKIVKSKNIQFFNLFLITQSVSAQKVYFSDKIWKIENDQILKQKYHLKKLCGGSGNGEKNHQKKINEYMVITKFHSHRNPPGINKYFKDKFLNEYKLYKKFSKRKSHFIDVYGYSYKFLPDPKDKLLNFEFTIVMEKAKVVPLDYFKDFKDEKSIIREIMWLTEGYQHMVRKKIIHGDIKPNNILLGSNEKSNIIGIRGLKEELKIIDYNARVEKKFKIIDFGSSRKLNTLGAAHYTPFCGDSRYISPELLLYTQFQLPSIYFDPLKSDVFSLGLTILEFLGKKIDDLNNFVDIKTIPEDTIKDFVLNGLNTKNQEDISRLFKSLNERIDSTISGIDGYGIIKTLLANMLKTYYNQRWNYHDIQSYLIDFIR